MKQKISNLLLAGAIAVGLTACGSSSSDNSKEKTIKGLALKADGSAFTSAAKVVAVDVNGNTSEGTVDASGFKVTLVADSSSGKKNLAVNGNTFLRITEGTSTMDLIIGEDQTNVNVNAVTAAASGLALGSSGVDLDVIFAAANTANGKKLSGAISNAGVLAALAKVKVLTAALFKGNSQTIVNALFGFDSLGNSTIDADNLVGGGSSAKEIILIKAAAKINSNLIADAVSAANDPDNNSFLFDDPDFFAAVGNELADASGTASSTAYSDFLNSVVKSSELKAALVALKAELNAYVTAYEADATTDFDVVIPDLVEGSDSVTVTASISGNNVTYSIAGAVAGDTTESSLIVFSGTSLEATVTAKLTATSTTVVAISNVKVIIGDISVSVSDTAGVITNNTVDLAVALTKAKAALATTSLSDVNVPTSVVSLSLYVAGTPVIRSGDPIATYITVGSTTAASDFGVILK